MRPMRSIIAKQRSFTEVGRIRLGEEKIEGERPKALDMFRFTSRNERALKQAAGLWGGDVIPWSQKPGQFQLYTEVNEIPILIAPQEIQQAWEFWTKGGCQRRCDGAICDYSGKDGLVEKQCVCFDEDGQSTEFGQDKKQACQLYTRVKLFLPDIHALGTWMLVTKGFYASEEIPMAIELLTARSRERHEYPEALLAIEKRTSVVAGVTRQFVVPVIRIDVPLREVLSLPVGRETMQPASPGELEAVEQHYRGHDLATPEPVIVADVSAHQDAAKPEQEGVVEPHSPPAWPVYGGEADQKLKEMGAEAKDAAGLQDAGVSEQAILSADATDLESLQVEVE